MPDDETTQMQVAFDEALARRDAIRGRIRLMVRSEAAGSDLLTDGEIKLLRRALAEWGGPAHCRMVHYHGPQRRVDHPGSPVDPAEVGQDHQALLRQNPR
ncbi:hypothetical protein [Streptomyces tanashiensis]|uniref:hypothetical protein n=1 Tax=Streptomyces tanashiensis TaxID=67367 RepID=UPI0016794149|nr:hypothetical protein [Streptomyces tanashiensis]